MSCPFCHCQKTSQKIPIESAISKKTVYYHICKECRSAYQYPLPDQKDLEKYYDSYFEIKQKMNPGYLDEGQLSYFFDERDKTLAEIGFDLKKVINSVNVELGCANGHFLRYLIKNGATDITGIDISQNLLSSIKIEKVRLIYRDLSCVQENSADNVFLFNILEHIPDLLGTMDQLVRILKTRGQGIMEVPLSGIISASFGKKWRFYMPDEHINIPSIKGLKTLLSGYGLKIIGYTRFGSGFTKGMIPNFIKYFFDFFVKLLKIGDRGTFLVIKKDPK